MLQVGLSFSGCLSNNSSLFGEQKKKQKRAAVRIDPIPTVSDRSIPKDLSGGRGVFISLNSKSLRLLRRQKEKEAGIPFSIFPNKQHADEKWEHKQAGEPRMCSPHSEKVPLESETIFSEGKSERERERYRELTRHGASQPGALGTEHRWDREVFFSCLSSHQLVGTISCVLWVEDWKKKTNNIKHLDLQSPYKERSHKARAMQTFFGTIFLKSVSSFMPDWMFFKRMSYKQ